MSAADLEFMVFVCLLVVVAGIIYFVVRAIERKNNRYQYVAKYPDGTLCIRYDRQLGQYVRLDEKGRWVNCETPELIRQASVP